MLYVNGPLCNIASVQRPHSNTATIPYPPYLTLPYSTLPYPPDPTLPYPTLPTLPYPTLPYPTPP